MKASVDQSVGIGCELWTQTCPGVFKMEGDVAIAYASPVPKQYEDLARQAADECPVQCISID